MSATTEKTRTETRTLAEWLEHQIGSQPTDRTVGGLKIIRYPEHDVVLVHDGTTIWAARPADLDAALEGEVTYRIRSVVGRDEVGDVLVATMAYSDLCQDVPALAPDEPGVAEACDEHGMDTDALTY